MGIDDLDSWEYQYVKDLKGHELLAWTDKEAFKRYPYHSWVYDKLALAKACGTPTISLEERSPKTYPVIIKPKVNLEGMGQGAYIANSPEDIEQGYGFIAQKLLRGSHVTTDYVVQNSRVIDSFSFRALYRDKSFYLFKSIENRDPKTRAFLEGLKLHDGIVNIETIGGDVIEMHLRPSTQFYDICGGLIEQVPSLIETGKWQPARWESTYSRVYRTAKDHLIPQPKKPKLIDGITSIQYTWEYGGPLSAVTQDSYSYRYMVVNGTDLRVIEPYAAKVTEMLFNS